MYQKLEKHLLIYVLNCYWFEVKCDENYNKNKDNNDDNNNNSNTNKAKYITQFNVTCNRKVL